MALRKIETFTGNNRVAKVYRDSEWNEYRVTYMLDGAKIVGGDYHTDDKQDALDTAQVWVG